MKLYSVAYIQLPGKVDFDHLQTFYIYFYHLMITLFAKERKEEESTKNKKKKFAGNQNSKKLC